MALTHRKCASSVTQSPSCCTVHCQNGAHREAVSCIKCQSATQVAVLVPDCASCLLPAGPRQYSKAVEKLRGVAKAATVTIPPTLYVKNKSDEQLQAALEALLEKHDLDAHSGECGAVVTAGLLVAGLLPTIQLTACISVCARACPCCLVRKAGRQAAEQAAVGGTRVSDCDVPACSHTTSLLELAVIAVPDVAAAPHTQARVTFSGREPGCKRSATWTALTPPTSSRGAGGGAAQHPRPSSLQRSQPRVQIQRGKWRSRTARAARVSRRRRPAAIAGLTLATANLPSHARRRCETASSSSTLSRSAGRSRLPLPTLKVQRPAVKMSRTRRPQKMNVLVSVQQQQPKHNLDAAPMMKMRQQSPMTAAACGRPARASWRSAWRTATMRGWLHLQPSGEA